MDKIPVKKYDTALQFKYTKLMQFLIGLLNWLSILTQPDIPTMTNLLEKHMGSPSKGHIEAEKKSFVTSKAHSIL